MKEPEKYGNCVCDEKAHCPICCGTGKLITEQWATYAEQEIERLRGLVKEQAEAIVVSFSAGEFNVCIFCGTEITHNAGFDANNKSFWKDTTTHDPTCIVLKSKAVLGEE